MVETAVAPSGLGAAVPYGRAGLPGWLLSTLGVACAMTVWQIAAMLTSKLFLASPLDVLRVVPTVLAEGLLGESYLRTMLLFLSAFLVSAVTGVAVGLGTSLNKRANLIAEPLLIMFYATPSIVMIPLFVLWFGIGDLPKAALVFLATFFPIVINTQLGIREMGPEMRELGRAFGATVREQVVKILIPATIPHLATAVRVAMPRAFVAQLLGEMLISVGGMGSLLVTYSRVFRTDAYFLAVLVIVFTSMALSWATRRLEVTMTPWRAGRAETLVVDGK